MKIRNGFVSNSSSSNFMIPTCFLTDEQKEVLLSMDDSKEVKRKISEMIGNGIICNSDNTFHRNEEYHRILSEMIEKEEFDDSPWEIGINKWNEKEFLNGSTFMWNGGIEKFMEKIGIDVSALEIYNEGYDELHKATHPEAIKIFHELREEFKKEYKNMSEEDKEFLGDDSYENNPYAK